MRRVNDVLAVAGLVFVVLMGEARANNIPADAQGILLLRETPTQSKEFTKKVVYYSSFIKMASGAPLYSISLADGGSIIVESWAIAKVYPFDQCFAMPMMNDADFAWAKEKMVLFEQGAKEYPACAKALAEAAARMEDAVKRYQGGEVRYQMEWITREALDRRRHDAQVGAQTLKENEAKERARLKQDKLKREMEVMVAEAAKNGRVSEGIRKSLETLAWLRNEVIPRVYVQNESLLRVLMYLQGETKKMGASSGMKFDMKASKVDVLRRLDEATVTLDLKDIAVDRVLDAITDQTQTQLVIWREQVLLVSREDRAAWPDCGTLDDWKEEAARLYPALADETSELNKRIREAVKEKGQGDAGFFKKLDWPVRIAQSEAERLGIPPVKTRHGPDFIVCGPSPPKASAVASATPDASPDSPTWIGGLLSSRRPTSPPVTPQTQAGARRPLSHVQIAKIASPSVGIILTLDENGEPVAQGSGFVVQKDVLVTNHHVIEGNISHAAVRFPGINKTFQVDRLIADYGKADLVALHISDLPVPPLTIHRGGLPEIGTDVYVLGSPEGLSFTFSNGLISAVRANPHDSKLVWLQMTAPISHGSSGGPVLDENAEVIAVSVAVLESGQNLNFAVPAKYIRALLGDW